MNDSNSADADKGTWWQSALLIRGQTEADQRNIRIFNIWCFVTALGFAAAAYAPWVLPQLRGPFAWAMAIIPIVLGGLAVHALLRFLREADEFMRKVQLEGIALGFGAAHVFCLGYFILEQVGAPRLPMIVAVFPMAFGWAVGALLVASRYR